MKKFLSIIAVLALVLSVFCFAPAAKADALDEIVEYRIVVDVNDDGTLTMTYHFDWKVLDSTSEGPLSWLKIGIPNSNYISCKALSDTISSIRYYPEGGAYLRLDLDRDYYEDEVVSFDFELVQDYMYEMNRFTEGETYYEFTPGWFDAEVDKLIIKWNSANVKSVSPACLLREDGYYTWETSLDEGETFTVSAVYVNDAYGFDASKTIGGDGGGDYYDPDWYYAEPSNDFSWLGGLIVMGLLGLGTFAIIKKVASTIFGSTASFSGGSTKKKITREKIVYYSSCPGCGAPRQEGRDDCAYCGKSLIKSKETVTEEQVPEEVKNKTSNGTYHYGPDPNTFMRVHVVHVPVVTPHSSSSSSSRSSHSSCAHSSCACASHCACACACACAGGGRAGCSTKDFYNTGLKLEMLKKQAKK